ESAVAERHVELVLHVAQGPQATEHDPRPDLADELHRQPVERPHLDVAQRRDHLPQHFDSLLAVKSGCLSGCTPTPTIKRSNSRLPRRMTSRCPRWTGSNVPVQTAIRGFSDIAPP